MAVFVTQYNLSLSRLCTKFQNPNSSCCWEKSLQTDNQTQLQKRQKLYTPYILHTGGGEGGITAEEYSLSYSIKHFCTLFKRENSNWTFQISFLYFIFGYIITKYVGQCVACPKLLIQRSFALSQPSTNKCQSVIRKHHTHTAGQPSAPWGRSKGHKTAFQITGQALVSFEFGIFLLPKANTQGRPIMKAHHLGKG